MQYNVIIRESGHAASIETEICTEDQIKHWCDKTKTLAKEKGKRLRVTFRPREFEFEFGPDEDLPLQERAQATLTEEIKRHRYTPPKSDDSPSVCEILGRGD